MKRAGFTLIELLIVVAIIGILAAIAVPNFLNAQMRAKLSRVFADQKAVASAIEMYSLDHNRGPIGSLEGVALGVYVAAYRNALKALTTPVAYMGSVPLDPFMNAAGGTVESDTNRASFTYNNMQNPDWRAGNYQMAYEAGYLWYMFSPGPANTQGQPWPDYLLAANNPAYSGQPDDPKDRVYKTSNGLISEGWIIRTSAGMYE